MEQLKTEEQKSLLRRYMMEYPIAADAIWYFILGLSADESKIMNLYEERETDSKEAAGKAFEEASKFCYEREIPLINTLQEGNEKELKSYLEELENLIDKIL